MDKRMIIAKAGAGKTYYICHELDKSKRNVIITYTNQNVKNIYKELLDSFGEIPENTTVLTFHSFIYRYMIRPFDKIIGEYYGKGELFTEGVSLKKPPEPSFVRNGYRVRNRNYFDVTKLEHFLDGKKYYSDLMSDLILRTRKKKFFSLIDVSCNFINKFFDYIYIDEVQDFRKTNWKLIEEIIKRVENIVLVGDYYQNSVNALNNSGEPFGTGTTYELYIEYLKSIGLSVDETTLSASRRVPLNICNYIKQKLNINIECDNANEGNIIWVEDIEDGRLVLKNNNIVKLLFEESNLYDFKATTWGYSKGDTYENACVILTETLKDIKQDDFAAPINSTTNKLYVALTRSKGNVYLMKREIFEIIKEEFLIKR